MRSTQSGNALVIILITIALLAALAMTFSRSTEQGSGSMTKQQARIAAQEIINYGAIIANRAEYMRNNGCSEADISFENSVVSGYNTNATTPADGSCKIFNSNGGKLTYTKPQTTWLDTTKSAVNSYGDWFFTGQAQIDRLGSMCPGYGECSELLIMLPYVTKDVCDQINAQLNLQPTYTDEGVALLSYTNANKFNGVYNDDAGEFGNEDFTFQKKPAGCFYRSWNTHYVFYTVLAIR